MPIVATVPHDYRNCYKSSQEKSDHEIENENKHKKGDKTNYNRSERKSETAKKLTKIINSIEKISNQFSQEELEKDLGIKVYQKIFGDKIAKQAQITASSRENKQVSGFQVQYLPSLPAQGAKISLRDMPYHLAGCCQPKRYEAGLGVIKKNADAEVFADGRGIFIHYPGCPNLNDVLVERRHPILWSFDVIIEVANRHGMLHEITAVLEENKINIEESHVKRKTEKKSEIMISVDICDRQELQQVKGIFQHIKEMPDVYNVKFDEPVEVVD